MTKAKRFENFAKEIAASNTNEEREAILYRADGVDMAYRREQISWEQHEILFTLCGKMDGGAKA